MHDKVLFVTTRIHVDVQNYGPPSLSSIGLLLHEPQLQALKRQLPHTSDVCDLLQIVQHLGNLHGLLLNHPVHGSPPALLRHLGVTKAGLEESDESGRA